MIKSLMCSRLLTSMLVAAVFLSACNRNKPAIPADTGMTSDMSEPNSIQARVVEEADPVMQGVDAELLGNVSGIKHATLPSAADENPALGDTASGSDDGEIQKALDTQARGSTEPRKASIELVWRVPEQSVQHYVLSYGSSPEQMFHRVIIPLERLNTSKHPNFGQVYSYVLHGIDMHSALYFTLQAGNSTGLSTEAPVQKIDIR